MTFRLLLVLAIGQLTTSGAEKPKVVFIAITPPHNPGNHGIRSERWRSIRYADGSGELYDHRSDPDEWANLAGRPEHAAVVAEHRRWLPEKEHPPVPGSAQRVLSYDPGRDEAVWEGTTIRRGDAVPERGRFASAAELELGS